MVLLNISKFDGCIFVYPKTTLKYILLIAGIYLYVCVCRTDLLRGRTF